ncbi:hypothetical protein ACFYNO_14790 [Kitasatospora sp. NPDC006697]|uniref:hypothetical protein n=1 Tax=unclassified Kitasatospora TaxID=2633591 RepID=UPI0036AF5AE8
MDETCWDDVAMRGIVAMVLYALHLRDRQPVDEIRWQKVLWQLRDDQRVGALVTVVLPGGGHDLSPTGPPGEPVTECWRWLTRIWDPHAPAGSPFREPALTRNGADRWVPDAPEPRWGGLSRGIGRGLPDPALEVCTGIWAAGVVQQAILTERGGHRAHDRVKVTAGPLKGYRGYVREIGWSFDDAAETVEGPAGYVVDLDNVEGAERIDADQVTASSDLTWPHCPEGTLKDGPPLNVDGPLPPARTCADDLREILGRAANPDVVPEQLRRTISAARRHHHVQLDWQASPAPQRFTWRVVLHWYQLADHCADDQRADLYEVIVTRHLHDPEPIHHLALIEDDVAAMIARCTATP